MTRLLTLSLVALSCSLSHADAAPVSVHDAHDAHDAPVKWFMASDHKAGTYLSKSLLKRIADAVGRDYSFNWNFPTAADDPLGGHKCPSQSAFYFGNLHELTLKNLMRDCPSFKMVYMHRDPVQLVASAYLYHSHSEDCWPEVTPAVLSKLSTEQGLLVEAQAELKYTLPRMHKVFQAACGDARVKFMTLEDFDRDFDGSARALLDFFQVAPSMSKAATDSDSADVSSLMYELQKDDVSSHRRDHAAAEIGAVGEVDAQVQDHHRGSDSVGDHVHSGSKRASLARHIEQSTEHVFTAVRSYRELLHCPN